MPIPASVLYALPAIPIFVLGWSSQVGADRRVRKLSSVDANAVSDDVLARFLKSAGLEDVEVVKSENYLQNEHNEADGKIYLSPDTLDHRDVASVALALRAGAEAATFRKTPGKIAAIKSLRVVEAILFWAAFSVLAFGIMSSALVTTAIGYALVVAVLVVWNRRRALLRQIDAVANDFAARDAKLDPKTVEGIKAVLNAESLKY